MTLFGWPMTRQLLFFGFLLATCLFAALRGGRPERMAAFTLLGSAILSVSVARPFSERFADVEIGIFIIDAITLSAFLWLSIRSTRYWPLWIGAVLGAEITIHAIRMIVPGVIPIAYLGAQAIWSWIAQMMLLVGTVRHLGRLRRDGSDAPWKPRFRDVARPA